MKATIKTISLGAVLLTLASCGSDGGSATSTTSSGDKVTGVFSDSAVSNFQQTSGIAKTNMEKVGELIIASAYAGTGSISCFSGETVSFQMDALSNTVTMDISCAKDIDSRIRRNLLKSMDGIAIKRTVSDASFKNGALDFRPSGSNGGFQFNVAYKVPAIWKDSIADGGNNDGQVDANEICYERYLFVSNGTVSIAPHADNTTQNANNGSLHCATGLSYNDSASFRFKDGALELDLTYTNNFDPAHVFPSGHEDSGESSYEKWELCTVGTDCLN